MVFKRRGTDYSVRLCTIHGSDDTIVLDFVLAKFKEIAVSKVTCVRYEYWSVQAVPGMVMGKMN